MILTSILGNSQKLDGGAMFGNAPKAIWQNWHTPDIDNKIELACRCLLIQYEQKTILLETGIGAFFEPKLRQRYGVLEEDHLLLSALSQLGVAEEDVDFVVLSHLHFDHAGGLLSQWQEDADLRLLFPNAKYLVTQMAWDRAVNPHARDKASFIPKLNALLERSNRLVLIQDNLHQHLGKAFTMQISNGHTPGMLLTQINTDDGPLVFAADLIPGIVWMHLPITMGYDRFPELVIDEKKQLLTYLLNQKGRLFYTHDPAVAVSGLKKNETGHFEAINLINELNHHKMCA